jgi:hypothetical protein
LAIVHVDAVNAIFRKRGIIAEIRLGVLLQILRHSDNGRACQTSGRSGREGWIVIEKHLHRLKRPERSQCSRPRNPSLLIHPLPNAGPCAALQPPGHLSCFCFFFLRFLLLSRCCILPPFCGPHLRTKETDKRRDKKKPILPHFLSLKPKLVASTRAASSPAFFRPPCLLLD